MTTIKVQFPHLTPEVDAVARLAAIAPFKLHNYYPDMQVGANKSATAIIEVGEEHAEKFHEIAGLKVEILRDQHTRRRLPTSCGTGCCGGSCP